MAGFSNDASLRGKVRAVAQEERSARPGGPADVPLRAPAAQT